GYVLDDTHWGKGLMIEAVNAVLKYAFKDLELDKVIVGHALDNNQSKRVIEKAGFEKTHQEKREHFDKTMIDIQMYEITKEHYLKGE
ncbi:MAG: N-acetyltransferase, partial [Tenericutes bacterium HGW-Tenericutes-3]